MNKSFFQKLVATIIAVAIILPVGSLLAAENKGTIEVKVVNQDGEAVMGNWKLHQGVNTRGLVRRNGTNGKSFQFEEGTYYLVANLKNEYRYTLVTSENPQTLKAGEKVTFVATYYKTEAEHEKAREALVKANKAKEAVKSTEEKTVSTTNKKEEAKKEPTPESRPSDEEVAAQKESLAKARQEDLAMRQRAAAAARAKAGSGDVANTAQRKAAENKAQAEAEAKKKAEETKKEEVKKEEVKKEDTVAAAKVAELKRRAAGKAKAEEIRAARAKRANTESTTAANLTKAPALAATGTGSLIALMLPSLAAGLAFTRKK